MGSIMLSICFKGTGRKLCSLGTVSVQGEICNRAFHWLRPFIGIFDTYTDFYISFSAFLKNKNWAYWSELGSHCFKWDQAHAALHCVVDYVFLCFLITAFLFIARLAVFCILSKYHYPPFPCHTPNHPMLSLLRLGRTAFPNNLARSRRFRKHAAFGSLKESGWLSFQTTGHRGYCIYGRKHVWE